MIIFYPPPDPFCTPVVIADMTDSSDQWSTAEITLAAYLNMPEGIYFLAPPLVYSCKYNYEIRHNGLPLGESLKMTLNVSVKMPPSDLIAQVSIGFVSDALDPAALTVALVDVANPQLNTMYAAVVEKTGVVSTVCRSFVAFSSVLQPDSYGTSATLFIRGASFHDTLVKSVLGFQLNTVLPLGAQLTALAASAEYILDATAAPAVLSPPVCGKLFQPTTLAKILDEICLQNKLLYTINGKIITLFSQTSKPIVGADIFSKTEFSFLGSSGAVMWAAGVENYSNVKFKTPIFNASLFSTITIYDDSTSGLFSGLKQNFMSIVLGTPASYDMIIIRYAIIRNDGELCCEVTSTNNWLFSQIRADGIFEAKIYGKASA